MGEFYVVRFGRYKGQHITEIPSDYLWWLARDAGAVKAGFRRAIQMELDRRDGKTTAALPPGAPGGHQSDPPWMDDQIVNPPPQSEISARLADAIEYQLGMMYGARVSTRTCIRCRARKLEGGFDRKKNGDLKNVCSDCSKYLSKRTREGMRKKFEGAK